MKLSEYFENAKGVGVISTSDKDGKVNAAIFSRPHFIEENTVAFIAADRLTHANLQTNTHAVYLFKEDGRYEGKRLYMTKIREEKDSQLIDEIRRKKKLGDEYKTESRFLIYFKVDEILPLIGDGK